MKEKEVALQSWSERVDALSAEYERAKVDTSHLYEQMNSAWQVLHKMQVQYREYKEQANREFEQAQYCWSMYDGAGAKEHSESGYMLIEKKAGIGLLIDEARAIYSTIKSQFDAAVVYQKGIKAELDQVRNAYKSGIEELKTQNQQERTHWKEKPCSKCGGTIRYHDMWSYIPNYCKSCKEKMNAEREEKKAAEAAKWKEKPCGQCGKLIKYNIEWTNYPNFCSECKEKFEQEKREREKNRREKACMNCGKTIIYYVDWLYIPNYCNDCKAKFGEARRSRQKTQEEQESV